MEMASFHEKCGFRVTLTNNNRTAVRDFSEFNNGLVLSKEPLVDNEIFQVRIEKAINSWSGSIEIGVIAADPGELRFPSSATELRNGSWILSGTSLAHNGRSVGSDGYSSDLDLLTEGDVIGVMRTDKGQLKFFINGECQGVAADNIPDRVYAVIDMYGRCAQVSIVSNNEVEQEADNEEANNVVITQSELSLQLTNIQQSLPNDRLRFHSRHGSLIKLSCNARTAERCRPLDEFNNGVVMTHRPLRDDELFEIRIDKLVDKWSGSIEVGVTTHNPNMLEFPATMTNMRSGTTIMSGSGILTNGRGTKKEYGDFNLDKLREGDRIGMMRKSNGNLHYFINGLDQDAAAEKVANTVWGVVDLYGMTVKVTIVDRDEREEHNLMTRRYTSVREYQTSLQRLNNMPEEDVSDRLMFHSSCGSHAAVINSGRTVHRPNAIDDFNNGVVLTNRALKPNELFEIRLDKMVLKWAGSIEIGVTTHSPTELEYPSTMTNIRSGTWMMTGNGVMHNGTTIIDEYGHSLDRLKIGDRVGAMRKACGALHFYVNGIDQGVAAINVPVNVYGVIDLYGQAAQATIVDVCDYSPETDNSSLSNTTLYSDLRFYHIHGRNARVSNNGLTASRPRTLGEFNHAIVITNRPLRDNEMFEVKIQVLVDRWSGSIEAGVTAIRPQDFEFLSTMTDMERGTWMLSGSSVMKDGFTIRNGYPCDLDSLAVGTRLGMMRHDDTTLHYYVDDVDQGPACDNVPSNVYAVIDLYGQCAQVSIVNCGERTSNPVTSTLIVSQHVDNIDSSPPPVTHRLNSCCGKNITLDNSNCVATRNKNYAHGLLFSTQPLDNEEIFEVSILETCNQWSGSLSIGLTTLAVNDSLQSANLPPVISGLSFDTWYLSRNEVKKNHVVLKTNYCPSLEWLTPRHKVGVQKTSDGAVRFLIDGVDMGVAATGLPKKVFGVVDLFGSTTKIAVCSIRRLNHLPHNVVTSLQDSLEILGDGSATPVITRLDMCLDAASIIFDNVPLSPDTMQVVECNEADLLLSDNHGRNIQLSESKLTARRIASYNQGIVLSHKPLTRGTLFQIRIDKVNPEWSCGLAFGVIGLSASFVQLPVNALGFKDHSWIIYKDVLLMNGRKVLTIPSLAGLTCFSKLTIGLMIDYDSQLHVFVNGCDMGVVANSLPASCYSVFDLNGKCEEISVVRHVLKQLDADTPLQQHVHFANHDIKQDSQQEKADLEVQEKPRNDQSGLVVKCKPEDKRRLSSVEQKLSSSESYNSGIQQITSNAASCSHQSTDTDNFNTQIQQLTQNKKLQEENYQDRLSQSDTYNTELQLLSSQTQVNLDQLNTQIQQLTTSNSGQEIGSVNNQRVSNIPHSQSQPFLQRTTTPTNTNKLVTPPHNINILHRSLVTCYKINCDYFSCCVNFKNMLGLPDGFFTIDSGRCYCSNCYQIDDIEEAYKMKGEPPTEYSIPMGWSKFPLRKHPCATDKIETWHVAYYGTKPGAIRRILDTGELVVSDDGGLERTFTKVKEDSTEGSHIVFSPSIKYASSLPFLTKFQYVDRRTKKKLEASLSFQILVQPGSYKVGPPSVESVRQNDSRFDQHVIEWVTKERGATVLSALLIKIEGAS